MAFASMDRTCPAAPAILPARSTRAGVTLIEVLVCLMLVSLLAAAVFPVVTQRVSRDEPLRMAAQVTEIVAAMEGFATDLGGAAPGDLEDLTAPIGHGDRTMTATAQWQPVTETDARRWRGPYLEAAIADGGSLLTGFGVPIRDDLIRFDAERSAPSGTPKFERESASLFLALQIGSAGRQLTAGQFEAVNDLVDGLEERAGPGDSTSWTLGRLRFDNSSVAADTIAYYLAMPVGR